MNHMKSFFARIFGYGDESPSPVGVETVDTLQAKLAEVRKEQDATREALSISVKICNRAEARANYEREQCEQKKRRLQFIESSIEDKISGAYACGLRDGAAGIFSRLDTGEPIDTFLALASERIAEIKLLIAGSPTMFDLVNDYIPELIREIERVRSEQRGLAYYATGLRKCEAELDAARRELRKHEPQSPRYASLSAENAALTVRCNKLNETAEQYRLKIVSLETDRL